MNLEKLNYDIIILAGQSNAEGNGHGGKVLPNTPNVYQLVDINPCTCSYDFGKENDCLQVSLPVQTKIEEHHERGKDDKFADLTVTFVKDYIDSGLLKTGRRLLVIKAAVGGSGFALNQWGINSKLSQRLIEMVKYALNLNSENKVVAFLWHQGEHDAFENPNLTLNERYEFYENNFMNEIKLWRKEFNTNFPLITGGFVNDWADKFKDKTDIVEKALIDSCEELGCGSFVLSDGLLSNDQDNHNGDDIHFCRDSVYELGHRYFKAYLTLIE